MSFFFLLAPMKVVIYLNYLCSAVQSPFQNWRFCSPGQSRPQAIVNLLRQGSRIGLNISIGLLELSSPALSSISYVYEFNMQ